MDYVMHILIFISIYSVLAISYNLVCGYGGLLSLAHGAFYGLGAYLSVLLAMKLGVPFLLAVTAGFIFTAIFAALVVIPLFRLRGDYWIMGTMGVQMVVYGILLNWVDVTRGSFGIYGIPRPDIFGLTFSSLESYFALTVAVALVMIFILWRLADSPFGRTLKSTRDDEEAALSLGKDVLRYRVMIFGVTGGVAAVMGALYAHYIRVITPAAFTLHETVYILVIMIVGGSGNLKGSILGATLLLTLGEALRFAGLPSRVMAPAQQIVFALLLIGLMRFRPQGLIGEYKLD